MLWIMLTNPLIRQQRVVDVIVILLLPSHWKTVTDICGITGIAKHFRLRRDPWLTKQQQYHEMLLKCRCLYKKKSFWPEALTISLQEKSPTVTPAMGWSVMQGKLDMGCSAAGSVICWWAGLQSTQLHQEEGYYLQLLWECILDQENVTLAV